MMESGALDPLRDFSEACHEELSRLLFPSLTIRISSRVNRSFRSRVCADRSSAFGGRGMIDDFQHVSVTCRDLERSIHFYERLGLKVIQGLWETVDLFRPGHIDNTMPWTGESCVRPWYGCGPGANCHMSRSCTKVASEPI